MKTVSKSFWMITLGLVLSIMYLSTGVILCLSIVGIPFALKYFKLSEITFNPSGKKINVDYAYNTTLNTIWFLLFGGMIFFILHVLFGVIMCITIIGIPIGKDVIKSSLATAFPFGMEVVRIDKEFDYVPYENERYKGRKKIKPLIFVGALLIVLSVIIFGFFTYALYNIFEDFSFVSNVKGTVYVKDKMSAIINYINNNDLSFMFIKNNAAKLSILGCLLTFLIVDLGVVLLRIGIVGKVVKKKIKKPYYNRFDSNPEERMHIRAIEAKYDPKPEYKKEESRIVVTPSAPRVTDASKKESAIMNQIETNSFVFEPPIIDNNISNITQESSNIMVEDIKPTPVTQPTMFEKNMEEKEPEVIKNEQSDDEIGLFIPEDDFETI